MRLTDETLRGRTVIASDGLAVGQVAAVFLNSDGWVIESLLVALRREIADSTRGQPQRLPARDARDSRGDGSVRR